MAELTGYDDGNDPNDADLDPQADHLSTDDTLTDPFSGSRSNRGSTRAISVVEQRELLHEIFIELQDYLHGQSVFIGDSHDWGLFAFTEFMAGLELTNADGTQ